MANQRRSVWEIRFLAIDEFINARIGNYRLQTADLVLRDGLSEERKIETKIAIKELREIKERLSFLDSQTGSEIWLSRDF